MYFDSFKFAEFILSEKGNDLFSAKSQPEV